MTILEAQKLINKILKGNLPTDEGIFISLLSQEYMKKYNIPKKHFIRSLQNSLKILEKTDD